MDYEIQKLINRVTFGLTEMGPSFRTTDIWYNFKYGIKNLRRFFWVIWKWRGWDYSYNLGLMARGLEVYVEQPNYEVDETRVPKERAIKRVIELIKRKSDADYITEAEKELEMELSLVGFDFVKLEEEGKEDMYEMVDKRSEVQKENDTIIYDMSKTIEQREWKELFKLIEKGGQGWWN